MTPERKPVRLSGNYRETPFNSRIHVAEYTRLRYPAGSVSNIVRDLLDYRVIPLPYYMCYLTNLWVCLNRMLNNVYVIFQHIHESKQRTNTVNIIFIIYINFQRRMQYKQRYFDLRDDWYKLALLYRTVKT